MLFVIKRRYTYGSEDGCYGDRNTGLYSSANFLANMLVRSGVLANVAEVTDNNDIDRVVRRYSPTHVIIEAYWVVPEKFTVLRKLYPKVQWIVRDHSGIPFLAQEGVAIQWTKEYVAQPNVRVASNSAEAVHDLQTVLASVGAVGDGAVIFLPNYYPVQKEVKRGRCNGTLHVGCFGAVRPLKNQLIQALAAMEYAQQNFLRLFFHINTTPEQNGLQNLKNLRALFVGSEHCLVEHPWLERNAFLSLLRTMDVEMAVSFTETFCIVAADAVACGTPLVCSDQVPWACEDSLVEATKTHSIVRGLYRVLGLCSGWITRCNQNNLFRYSEASRKCWLNFFRSEDKKVWR